MAAAHCAHYLSVAETAAPHLTGPDQGSWLARLDADQANLRRAAEHAASRPDGTAQVLRFGVALWRYWVARSRNEEAAGLLVPVLGRPEAAADPALFAEALVVASELTLFTDMPTSLQLAEQAVEVAGRLGDDRLLALSRGTLSCRVLLRRRAGTSAAAGQRRRSSGPGSSATTCCWAGACCAYARPSTRRRPGRCTPRPSPAPSDPATLASHHLHNNAGRPCPGEGGHPRRPGSPGSRDTGRGGNRNVRPPRHVTEPGLGPAGRTRPRRRAIHIRGMPCGSAAGTATRGTWPTPSSAWRAWPAIWVTGTGQPRCTASRRPCSTRREFRGNGSTRGLRQESLDQARQALGDEQLERAYARGMALSFDQAIDLALAVAPPAWHLTS